jgi:hypothetical protein
VRSGFAAGAAAWFVYNAINFIPQGAGVIVNPGNPGGLDSSDPGAVAITWAARALFVGLALLALALIEWGKILRWLRSAARVE